MTTETSTSVAASTLSESSEELEWLRGRIERLTQAYQGADGKRQVAMYHAVRLGASLAEVARWGDMRRDEAEALMAEAAADPDMPTMRLGPVWVEFWPHKPGWGPSR